MQLRTRRLLLREFIPSDVMTLSVYHAAPSYREHDALRADAETIVGQALLWSEEQPRRNYQLAIAESETSLAIGAIGLRGTDHALGVAEFGCELDPAYWGRGYAREAAVTLLGFGSRVLKLRRVTAICAIANVRVHHLLESLGFTREPDPNGSSAVRFTLAKSEAAEPGHGSQLPPRQ